MARRRKDPSRLRQLEEIRAERFALMERLALLPNDLVFYTQITMEAAEDVSFLQAMKKARIMGALVGVEAVTPEGVEGHLQGLQLRGRRARDQTQEVPRERSLRPRVVHLRSAERPSEHIRCDR